MGLLTENVHFSLRIFWLAAKTLQLPALPGLRGIACFILLSKLWFLIGYVSQVSFPERGGDPSQEFLALAFHGKCSPALGSELHREGESEGA